ncbi:cobalamin biosynthesis protein (plasmid) [Azospirillum sp. TSH58]|uniref:cobalamin biosynthesis protein n=1 Tax=Azospirillum sp. TSH58 TaxID=664962 RepID=UPI000D5FFCB0|nr:cobalamin biosynthesis protein [Azospirillum sp. TSH58]AWJ86558.1 cobalamin biosynthesis protein [Azospirillum sp. TSH58]PWC69055.1 cobalamin biosynthesis protein [Azospirillum sp. TSH58]
MTADRVIAAGIGCRTGCPGDEIAGLLRAAFEEAALDEAARRTVRLAAPMRKRNEAGVAEAARRLALPLQFVDDSALAAAQDRTRTRSSRVEAAVGVASVAEAAALAAAGPGSSLLLSRRSTPRATCALAISREVSA